MENQLSPRQADLLNENVLRGICMELGAEIKFGFCSDVRSLELNDALENAFQMLMQQNWINTEKLN